jgi:CRP/FNR family transcriptional regulator, cyclic AMP receptor protein
MTPALTIYQLAVMANAWFSELPINIQSAILKCAKPKFLDAGTRLFSRGETANGLYLVKSGVIQISNVTPDGRQTILDFYGPNCWFGEVSLLDGLPRVHDASVYEDASLIHFSAAEFEGMIAQYPEFSRALLRLTSLRLRLLLTALETYSVESLERRLANRLLLLAAAHGASSAPGILAINLHLPQEILAQLVGATRQRISQILKDWEGNGLISHHYGKVILLDEARLKAITV